MVEPAFDESCAHGEQNDSEAREPERRETRVPGRLYQLIGEVLSYTAYVDSGEVPWSDDPGQTDTQHTDTQQGEVRSRC